MVFRIYNKSYNIAQLIRQMGYKLIAKTDRGELNCVRSLGGDYPRFHIYLTETPEVINFSLHLDQKRPVYEGVTAHGGDYESDVVQGEAQRIKDIILR